MDFVDSKYVNLVSSRLEKFKRVKADLFNFRCPICGDSSKNKTKTRGYLYTVKNNTNFKCHNCGASMSLNNFIKHMDTTLHKQYVMEKFKEGHSGKNFSTPSPKLKFTKPVFTRKLKIRLPKASENIAAKEYLEKRKLDPEKFYYTPTFKKWANTLTKAFDSTKYDDARIIIPLYTADGDLFGFQGRALRPSKVKYITIMLNDEHPKVYGMDTVDTNKTVYVVEGPFDSTFINNGIAMCGADVDLDTLHLNDLVYVYDNEPRNKEICARIEKAIKQGKKVVIFPSRIIEKDLNDMVLQGIDVNSVLESNTYQSLTATIKYNEWKRL
ncbi:MAG: DNA primase [Gammaproteobacteria bacterium]|nr:DNA primase [Gammaproteobacteria bacterium]|tara:strand:- start:5535 stop:6512 length:978 start_codon:yes stop_codon:yes gene_type:complete